MAITKLAEDIYTELTKEAVGQGKGKTYYREDGSKMSWKERENTSARANAITIGSNAILGGVLGAQYGKKGYRTGGIAGAIIGGLIGTHINKGRENIYTNARIRKQHSYIKHLKAKQAAMNKEAGVFRLVPKKKVVKKNIIDVIAAYKKKNTKVFSNRTKELFPEVSLG